MSQYDLSLHLAKQSDSEPLFYHHHVFHIIIYVSDVDMIIPKHDYTV